MRRSGNDVFPKRHPKTDGLLARPRETPIIANTAEGYRSRPRRWDDRIDRERDDDESGPTTPLAKRNPHEHEQPGTSVAFRMRLWLQPARFSHDRQSRDGLDGVRFGGQRGWHNPSAGGWAEASGNRAGRVSLSAVSSVCGTTGWLVELAGQRFRRRRPTETVHDRAPRDGTDAGHETRRRRKTHRGRCRRATA